MHKKVLIIAEAGVNHNGDLKLAKQLIDEASIAGADIVKFQTFRASQLVTSSAKKSEYQLKNTDNEESQYEMLLKLELSESMHRELIDYCKSKNIEFLSTGFDIESIDLLSSFDLRYFKIPSGEITNLPYLRHIGQLKKRIILSTGMSTLGEVESALNVLELTGLRRDFITILHCTTEYPTPMTDVNLRAMQSMRNAFNVQVGYSDHTLGIEIPIAAVSMGAKVIEKHLTLDRGMLGPDHKASLEPGEFASMVSCIRNLELAMGDGIKRPTPNERKNLIASRKSLVATKAIRAGELFTPQNISSKRPGNGVSPMRWDEIIGKNAQRDYFLDEQLDRHE